MKEHVMREVIKETKMRVLVFKENDWWVAQCLEYDIVACAKTLPDLDYELERVLVVHAMTARKYGLEPFACIQPAPEHFLEKYKSVQSKGLETEVPRFVPRIPTVSELFGRIPQIGDMRIYA